MHTRRTGGRTEIGPIIAIVLILGLLIFGAAYYLDRHQSRTSEAGTGIANIAHA